MRGRGKGYLLIRRGLIVCRSLVGRGEYIEGVCMGGGQGGPRD